ncbi:Hypothetical predicted protein [Olea europaea subsp. europaea]|uniref:Uncharacterized protein n=1 Tax=Olea europaea subsp. europaea TaxID=158383 RepID=A0A8S0T5C9_OLEEU|nr:Hypothetical predicted protein [Olea europaea subsp. europaea]
MQNMNTVSPWEVEHALSTPQLHPSKKLKAYQNSGILLDEGEESFDKNESSNSSAGHLNSSSSDQSRSSASLQGARLDQNAISYKVITDPVENVAKLESSAILTLANNGDSSFERLSVSPCGLELVGLQRNHSSNKGVVAATCALNGNMEMEERVCTLGLCVFAVGFKCWGFGI